MIDALQLLVIIALWVFPPTCILLAYHFGRFTAELLGRFLMKRFDAKDVQNPSSGIGF